MVLITLLASNAYAELQSNKTFKVCPQVVTAKDTPCRVLGPTASVVQRDIVKEDPRDTEIAELKAKIKILEDLLKNYDNTKPR